MDGLTIDIKKITGVLKTRLKAVKMSPQKGIDRIRLKTLAVKAILEERGYKPGATVHANNAGVLDNSESSGQFNLETTWVFEDLEVPDIQPEPKNEKATELKTTQITKNKTKNSKAKN